MCAPLPLRRFKFRLQDIENSIICGNPGKPPRCEVPGPSDSTKTSRIQFHMTDGFSHFLSVLRDIASSGPTVFAKGHDRRIILLNHCSNLFGFKTHILRIQAVHNHDFRRSARTEYQALGHPQESSGRRSRPIGDYQPQRRLPTIQSVDRGIPLMAAPDRPARNRWFARNPDSAIPRSRPKPLRATAAGRHGDSPGGFIAVAENRAEFRLGT